MKRTSKRKRVFAAAKSQHAVLLPQTLLSFTGGSASTALIRLDRQRWRDVVTDAFADISKPATSPAIVKKHVDELFRLADAADEITEEWKAS